MGYLRKVLLVADANLSSQDRVDEIRADGPDSALGLRLRMRV